MWCYKQGLVQVLQNTRDAALIRQLFVKAKWNSHDVTLKFQITLSYLQTGTKAC